MGITVYEMPAPTITTVLLIDDAGSDFLAGDVVFVCVGATTFSAHNDCIGLKSKQSNIETITIATDGQGIHVEWSAVTNPLQWLRFNDLRYILHWKRNSDYWFKAWKR